MVLDHVMYLGKQIAFCTPTTSLSAERLVASAKITNWYSFLFVDILHDLMFFVVHAQASSIRNTDTKACAWTTKNIRSCNISTKRNEYQLVISALARRLSEYIISTFHIISYTYKYSTKISGKLLMINFFQTGPEVARLVQLVTKNAGSIAHLHHAELQHHLGCGHWSLHWRRHLAKNKHPSAICSGEQLSKKNDMHIVLHPCHLRENYIKTSTGYGNHQCTGKWLPHLTMQCSALHHHLLLFLIKFSFFQPNHQFSCHNPQCHDYFGVFFLKS